MASDKNRKTESKNSAKPFSDRYRNILTVAVVGVLMIVEGAGIVVAVKIFGNGPSAASGATGTVPGEGEEAAWLPSHVEIPVTDLMAFNSLTGRVFVYQLSVYADVEYKYSQKVQDLFESRHNTIDDRLSQVVRAADPKYLNEPGLETLRRQFKHELDQILGDDTLIREVLFPEFSKQRAD